MNPEASAPGGESASTGPKSATPLCWARTAVPPPTVNHGMVAADVAKMPVNATFRSSKVLVFDGNVAGARCTVDLPDVLVDVRLDLLLDGRRDEVVGHRQQSDERVQFLVG